MSVLQDPRKVFIQNIEKSSLKVTYTQSPFVLLCGGPVPTKGSPEEENPNIVSLRQSVDVEFNTFEFDDDSPQFTLLRPEEIEEWSEDALFKNLMDFEKELAAVSSLVVIILESAGSIAELGAFSQLPELSKKLIVFKSLEYGNETSFIDLGILKYLKSDYGENRVKKYKWKPLEFGYRPADIAEGVAGDVLFDINNEVKNLKKTSKYNGNYDTHVTALICEILSIFTVLKESEIFSYLVDLEVDISKDKLKRKLFILKRFSIVKIEEVSDAKFYYRTTDKFHSVNGFHSGGAIVDKLRLKTTVSTYYNEKKDRHRLSAIKNIGTHCG